MSLISILAAMGMVQYRNSVLKAQEAALRTDLFRMRDAIDQYYADKGKYPASLDALVSDGYLRKIPEDPITKSADTWQTVPAEPDPSNPSAEPGIYNVKSGARAPGSTARRTPTTEGRAARFRDPDSGVRISSLASGAATADGSLPSP